MASPSKVFPFHRRDDADAVEAPSSRSKRQSTVDEFGIQAIDADSVPEGNHDVDQGFADDAHELVTSEATQETLHVVREVVEKVVDFVAGEMSAVDFGDISSTDAALPTEARETLENIRDTALSALDRILHKIERKHLSQRSGKIDDSIVIISSAKAEDSDSAEASSNSVALEHILPGLVPQSSTKITPVSLDVYVKGRAKLAATATNKSANLAEESQASAANDAADSVEKPIGQQKANVTADPSPSSIEFEAMEARFSGYEDKGKFPAGEEISCEDLPLHREENRQQSWVAGDNSTAVHDDVVDDSNDVEEALEGLEFSDTDQYLALSLAALLNVLYLLLDSDVPMQKLIQYFETGHASPLSLSVPNLAERQHVRFPFDVDSKATSGAFQALLRDFGSDPKAEVAAAVAATTASTASSVTNSTGRGGDVPSVSSRLAVATSRKSSISSNNGSPLSPSYMAAAEAKIKSLFGGRKKSTDASSSENRGVEDDKLVLPSKENSVEHQKQSHHHQHHNHAAHASSANHRRSSFSTHHATTTLTSAAPPTAIVVSSASFESELAFSEVVITASKLVSGEDGRDQGDDSTPVFGRGEARDDVKQADAGSDESLSSISASRGILAHVSRVLGKLSVPLLAPSNSRYQMSATQSQASMAASYNEGAADVPPLPTSSLPHHIRQQQQQQQQRNPSRGSQQNHLLAPALNRNRFVSEGAIKDGDFDPLFDTQADALDRNATPRSLHARQQQRLGQDARDRHGAADRSVTNLLSRAAANLSASLAALKVPGSHVAPANSTNRLQPSMNGLNVSTAGSKNVLALSTQQLSRKEREMRNHADIEKVITVLERLSVHYERMESQRHILTPRQEKALTAAALITLVDKLSRGRYENQRSPNVRQNAIELIIANLEKGNSKEMTNQQVQMNEGLELRLEAGRLGGLIEKLAAGRLVGQDYVSKEDRFHSDLDRLATMLYRASENAFQEQRYVLSPSKAKNMQADRIEAKLDRLPQRFINQDAAHPRDRQLDAIGNVIYSSLERTRVSALEDQRATFPMRSPSTSPANPNTIEALLA